MEILPKIHVIPSKIVNTYLLIDPQGVALIDTGIPGSERKILAYLADQNLAAVDLKWILITHADIDHYGSLAALQRLCPAQAYASEVEARAIVAGKPSRELKVAPLVKPFLNIFERLTPIPPAKVDVHIQDNETLPILGGLRAISTPGHTPGHTSYYLEEHGVLFCGDSIVCHAGKMRLSSGFNNWDASASLAAGQRQARLGARMVCSGHGEILPTLPAAWNF